MDGNDHKGVTAREKNALVRLLRLQARAAKRDVEPRQAELLAAFEEQLAGAYRWPAEWDDLTADAEEAAKALDVDLAQRCEKVGIPPEFRPRIYAVGRGENAARERRAELRAVARTQLVALGRQAKYVVDAGVLEREANLMSGAALTSGEARALLASMPSVEALMPPLELADVEAAHRQLQVR